MIALFSALALLAQDTPQGQLPVVITAVCQATDLEGRKANLTATIDWRNEERERWTIETKASGFPTKSDWADNEAFAASYSEAFVLGLHRYNVKRGDKVFEYMVAIPGTMEDFLAGRTKSGLFSLGVWSDRASEGTSFKEYIATGTCSVIGKAKPQ